MEPLEVYLAPSHEEVCVHPPSWLGVVCLAHVMLNDVSGRAPLIVVVWTTPPGVGILGHPEPRVFITPLTRVEENRLACGVEGVRLQGEKRVRIYLSLDRATVYTICLYWTLGSSCVPLILVLHQSIFTSEQSRQCLAPNYTAAAVVNGLTLNSP